MSSGEPDQFARLSRRWIRPVRYTAPMQSKATTVAKYLAELPADRRAAIQAVREVILKNLDKDYEEGMLYGMIGYYVPHRIFPAGYHCDPSKPIGCAGLASQKNYMSLYLAGVYCGCHGAQETDLVRWFHQAWRKTGKKVDMGKSCIRFRKIDDLPLEVIGEAIRRVPVKDFIEFYEKSLQMNAKAAGARAAAREAAANPKTRKTSRPAARKRVRARV